MQVVLALNHLDPDTWETYETDDIMSLLMEKFDRFPDTARIYHNVISQDHDVTPSDEISIKKLKNLDGKLYVVVYPEGVVAAIVIAIVAVVAAVVLKPKIPSLVPTVAQRNRRNQSSNNELSDRENQPRPQSRIPDIYGSVVSTPDLLSVPLTKYENNQQLEYAYMCIGRGSYAISSDKIYDDETAITQIAGTSIEIYAPYTSPNSGDAAQLTVGTPISRQVKSVHKSNSVNGQTLRPPNSANVTGTNDIVFAYPDEITTTSDYNFDDRFAPGDEITVTNASDTVTVSTVPTAIDLAGTYTILSVSSNTIVLSNPALDNSDWTVLGTSDELETIGLSSSIVSTSDKWIGPFTIDVATTEDLLCNFVASNGLYKDNGTTQTKVDVTVEVEATPINQAGTPIGSAETFQVTLLGSSTTTSERAASLEETPTIGGRQSVRCRRVTPTDTAYEGTVVDEVKWRDLYALSDPGKTEFGDVTTVWAKTVATSGALSIKSRKLNMDVTRKIPVRISGTTFSAPQSTDRISDIIVAVSTDQRIGNRALDELDLDNIYDTIDEVEEYFGTDKAVSFGYTFDEQNMSFEETIASIAGAAFCNAYRQGSKIKLSFEKQTEDSILLFNHRNKKPGSESRTISFGNVGDNDGVLLEYVDPVDGAIETFYVPEDQSAINPKKIETLGIKSKLHARFHAYRAYQKILYQNEAVEFTATQEADILVRDQRILVADNTRSSTQDGYISAQYGLSVTTSQAIVLEDDKEYVMFLQHIDGTVEAIDIVSLDRSNRVILAQAPKMALSVDINNYQRATYQVVEASDAGRNAFLVQEKEMSRDLTSTIRAVNYDDRFYSHDRDYLDGVVDEEGNVL
tara:strand:+ start:20020 stop:22584 length:2565 start_codon:yes stop_codon:yes gene_type:complete